MAASFNTSIYPNSSDQYYDIEIEHFSVGDHVIWTPGGQPLSPQKLDVGTIHRIVYFVSPSNKEYVLAFVYFYDWVPDGVEVNWPDGDRFYRLLVQINDIQLLDDYNNGKTKPSSKKCDINNNSNDSWGQETSSVSGDEGQVDTHIVRLCVLRKMRNASHPIITINSSIFTINKQSLVKGTVKKLFTDHDAFYIGAEFEMDIEEGLEHGPKCEYETNGCNKRIAINIANLSQRIWDSQFKLILNGTGQQVSFEELFAKTELPPPPYFLSICDKPVPSAPPLSPQTTRREIVPEFQLFQETSTKGPIAEKNVENNASSFLNELKTKLKSKTKTVKQMEPDEFEVREDSIEKKKPTPPPKPNKSPIVKMTSPIVPSPAPPPMPPMTMQMVPTPDLFGGGRGQLLDQIRRGKELKKISNERQQTPVASSKQNVASILMEALKTRRETLEDEVSDDENVWD